MVLGECPYCHKLFSAEEVSKEQVDSSLVTPEIKVPTRVLLDPVTMTTTSWRQRPEDVPSEDFIKYQITYRCKHCGKEWTKEKEREFDVPRSYAENEEEGKEAVMEKEEEEAREEQYARE